MRYRADASKVWCDYCKAERTKRKQNVKKEQEERQKEGWVREEPKQEEVWRRQSQSSLEREPTKPAVRVDWSSHVWLLFGRFAVRISVEGPAILKERLFVGFFRPFRNILSKYTEREPDHFPSNLLKFTECNITLTSSETKWSLQLIQRHQASYNLTVLPKTFVQTSRAMGSLHLSPTRISLGADVFRQVSNSHTMGV